MKYLFLVLLAASAVAQELPDKPTLGRTDKIMLVTLSGLNAADAISTMRDLNNGGHEQNPIARPFVTHGNGLASAYFGAATALDWFVVYKLNRSGHRKLSRAFLVGAIAAEVYCLIPKGSQIKPLSQRPSRPVWKIR